MKKYRVIVKFTDGETVRFNYPSSDKARDCAAGYDELRQKNSHSVKSVHVMEVKR